MSNINISVGVGKSVLLETKGKLCDSDIVVSAESDANLAAENIKSGVSIFGVTGTYDNFRDGYDSGLQDGEQAGYDHGYDDGYTDGMNEGGSAYLEALGALCEWTVVGNDGESQSLVYVANHHPSYYLHCDVIFPHWNTSLVVPPNSGRSAVAQDTLELGNEIYVTNVRWKASET